MNNESIYRFAAFLLLGTAMAISFSFRWRAAKGGDKISATREEGFWLAAIRSLGGLALWFGALLYLINPRWMAWSQVQLPASVRWLGAGIMLVCLPLVYWLFNSLGKNVTHTVAIRKKHTLVKDGPYRWVRHPLYSVGFLLFLGFSLLAANWFIALAILVMFPILAMRTSLEEARLIERFGDEYREYMFHTGRYIPRIRKGAAG